MNISKFTKNSMQAIEDCEKLGYEYIFNVKGNDSKL